MSEGDVRRRRRRTIKTEVENALKTGSPLTQGRKPRKITRGKTTGNLEKAGNLKRRKSTSGYDRIS
jgi:hypothetical protein